MLAEAEKSGRPTFFLRILSSEDGAGGAELVRSNGQNAWTPDLALIDIYMGAGGQLAI